MSDAAENEKIKRLVEQIAGTYQDDSGINFIDVKNLPVREKILEILDLLLEVLFPGYTGKKVVTRENIRFIVGEILCTLQAELRDQVTLALKHDCRMKECTTCDCEKMAEQITERLLNRLPAVREMLKEDVEAAFDGDPAAKSFEEIVVSYPYITAIAIHRIAHEIYDMEIPLIPRIMSESAHAKTGIDIHPGAEIGRHFFIDHGTGVVIGETTVIGDNVKLYQGVTLGALSFSKDRRGNILKEGKRHPTIEDNVTIYAEATILGDITIGKGAVISANTWVRKSVPAGVTVTMEKPQSHYKEHRHRKKHKHHKHEG